MSSVVIFVLALSACSRQPQRVATPPLVAQVSGTLALDGLSAPVDVVRDRWGVPHIAARSEDDLFFAQGFVQAQDRLFQMDLWRRSVQGRLAEVLGPNFIERDIMTRRIQYAGGADRDWEACGPEARTIARAFVHGINAWVATARERPPEEFRLAGWLPEAWREDDLLNRTDTFLQTRDAALEVMRARMVAAASVRAASVWLPGEAGVFAIPRGLDVDIVSYGVADALRRVGTAPFFLSVHAGDRGGSNAWAVDGRRTATGAPLVANDPHRPAAMPSLRYLVHLQAPGWNVIGATAPWLPGVAIGHNERVAWAVTALDADTQDLFVERVGANNAHQVFRNGEWVNTTMSEASVVVKGRAKPFAFRREWTAHGPVIAVDGERHLAYAVRWTGAEPGAAAELGATALDRARSAADFRRALQFWRAPAVEMVYADVDGAIGDSRAGLAPERRGWTGALPAPAWTGCCEWRAVTPLSEAAARDSRVGELIAANGDAGRLARIRDLLSTRPRPTTEDFKQWQHDVVAPFAARLIALLASVRSDRADVERAREQLGAWDRRVTPGSPIATLYVMWEDALVRIAARQTFPAAIADDYVNLGRSVTSSALDAIVRSRDRALLLSALEAAVDQWHARGDSPWGALHQLLFKHPLAVTTTLERRFASGPFAVGGYDRTVMATYGREFDVQGAAPFREIVDLGDWDRSLATNAPGQSGSPASAHFSDLAKPWAAGDYFPLVFTDRAIQANAESTLHLVPLTRR